MKCKYCGNPLPAECKFCPACGASVGKCDEAAADGRTAGKIEYSDKKLSVFLMKNLAFGWGYFYIGRSNLGALTVLIDILALLVPVIYLFARHECGFYFRFGLSVFVIVYLSMWIAALFVKTDGEGKRLW